MANLTLERLHKRYGELSVVDDVSLSIADGEFLSLLGPSGCGKTTILRMVAGLVDPSRGTIRIGDQDVTHLPPNKREIGLVFQSYALFPHLSVAENVAFGLRRRGVSGNELKDRVTAALALVRPWAMALASAIASWWCEIESTQTGSSIITGTVNSPALMAARLASMAAMASAGAEPST